MDEGFLGWMKTEDGEKEEQVNGKMEKRKSRLSGASGVNGLPAEGREIPLPQQPKEVQVRGVRTCRDCWAVVS